MELKVKVMNINLEKHHEVLEKCPVLKDYSIFIDTIRKYQEQNEDDSYRKAIQECIENGVLADYLRSRGSEVVNMLMSEYNYEMDIQVQREEAFEQGEKSFRKKFAALTEKLIADDRPKDVLEALQNEELCKKLFQEYKIEK